MNARLARTTEMLRRRVAGARSRGRHTGPHSPVATEVLASNPAVDVLELRLANGVRRNVLGRSTIERIESLVEFAPAATRVVLITAEGPDFCAGYDLLEAAEGDPQALIASEANFAPLRRSSRPIVAALSGNVIGGGLELALAADVRIASRDTRFAIPACALGLVYSEAGTRLLVEELGESMARAMLLSGRTISAPEALTLGLVSELVEGEELAGRALELATQMASWSPVATSGNRQVLDAVTGRSAPDVVALRDAAFAPNGALAQSIAAFVARRQLQPAPVSRRAQLSARSNELIRSAKVRGRELGRSLGRLLPSH